MSRPGTPGPRAGAPRVVAILPARIGSKRLPRKMLLAETGAPLFVHSARNVARCTAIERVVVATDSPEIRAAGERAGIETLATRADHASGTDRVREALGSLAGRGDAFDLVLNVQADEPDVAPQDLERLIALFDDPAVQAATLAAPLAGELTDPALVKVVRGRDGNALYFSRAPIPDASHARAAPADARVAALRHVGVYAFRPAALERFCALPHGRLEELENLEQLRWLEAGERMRVLDASRIPAGIDTRADYDAFVARERAATTMESSETR